MKATPVDFLRHHYHVYQRVKGELLDQNIAGRNVITRPDDVWLVSYPKSGNTWTRFLLANLVYKDRNVGFDNIERLVPDIYQHSNSYLQSIPSGRYLKSHEYFDPGYKKVISIVRDPRDIAISYYHHMNNFGRSSETIPMDAFMDEFVSGRIDRYGSWGENVGSWLGSRCANHEMLLLRYEDMLNDTVAAVKVMAAFLNIEVSEQEAGRVAANCSVEAMQSLERKQAADWKPLKHAKSGKLFVRKGKSGAWQEDMSDELANAITSAWKWQMQELGYDA